MSDNSTNAAGQDKATIIRETVIRIAGNSQDGIQSIGGFLARLAGRSEQEVMTFMTIPSTISGGPSIFQVRIGTGQILSSGDDADVLLAFYQHSYEGHILAVKEGGIVLYDSDNVEPNPEWQDKYHHVGIPISSLTIEALGGSARDKGKNMFAMGIIAKMFDLNVPKLERLIDERFGKKAEGAARSALLAFHAGYAFPAGTLLQTFRFDDGLSKNRHQVVMNGNEALGYGLLTAGIRHGAGYPITPWSDIMELLRRELPKYGGLFVQAEDEIAAISIALGFSYSGNLAVTGSSGPGISLKTEALGWAIMAEVPIIIVDVQRGGPSTGMPTNVEQSDLNIACFGGHGDAPRVVIAPKNVEDCFYSAIEAVNIARKYSVPVVLLTDQGVATRIEVFNEPDLKELAKSIKPDLSPVADHKPYDLSAADGITRHVAPGTRIQSGKYPVVTGLEHDEFGHPSGSPKIHVAMTEKRRKKLRKLASELPPVEVYGPSKGSVLIVGWGSTYGPIREAVDRCRAKGREVSSMHIRHLSPLPEGLAEIFANFDEVIAVEMNDAGLYGSGQLAMLLRSVTLVPIHSVTKTDGLSYRVREICAAVDNLAVPSPSVS